MYNKNKWISGLTLAVLLASTALLNSSDYTVVSRTGVVYGWSTTGPIRYNVDQGPFGKLTNAEAVALIEQAFNSWSSSEIPTTTLSFTRGSALNTDVQTSAQYNSFRSQDDGINPIILDTDGSLFADLGFAEGTIGFAGIEFITVSSPFQIVGGFAAFNGDFIDGDASDGRELTTENFVGILAHEFGHFLNLGHTSINGHYFLGDRDDPGFQLYGAPPESSITLMFPLSLNIGELPVPQLEDVRAVSSLYPSGSFVTSTIAGSVYRPDGTTLLKGANVIARNPADPFRDAVSFVSGGLHSPSTPPNSGLPPEELLGSYVLRGLTPGANYTVEVTNVNSRFSAGSSVGPLDEPIELGSPEEFYNGANESADDGIDNVTESTTVVAPSGTTTGIDIILNTIPNSSLAPPQSLSANSQGTSITLNWTKPAGTANLPKPGAKQAGSIDIRNVTPAERLVGTFEFAKSTATSNTDIEEIEPNNSTGQAQDLEGDSPIFVTGNAETTDPGAGTITFSDGTTDRVEDLFYANTIAQGLNLKLDGFTVNSALYYIDIDAGSATASARSGLAPEEIDLPNLGAGRHLVGVSIFEPDVTGDDSTAYRLTLTGNFSGGQVNTVLSYKIYRSNTSPVPFSGSNLLATVDGGTTTYTDENLTMGENWFYAVTATYNDGESPLSNEANTVVTSVRGGDDLAALPTDFALEQNFPNPFNPSTTIRYDVPEQAFVSLKVYDTTGKLVATLVEARQTAQRYSVSFDASGLSTGVYFYELVAGTFRETRKLLLVK